MHIKFWGTRGSVSAPGKERMRYGGHTTCVSVKTADNTLIIIDGGTGIKDLSDYISQKKSDIKEFKILMTHGHWDHIIGFPFFLPFYFKKYTIDFYGTSSTNRNLKKLVTHIWEPPFFPVPFEKLQAKFRFHPVSIKKHFQLGSATISMIPLNHPNGGLGYKIECSNKSFVFLTDNELSYRHHKSFNYNNYVNFASGSDLLVHDGQYTKKEYKITRGWGHSTYNEVFDLALKAKVKQVALTHHDYNHSDKEIDSYIKEGRNFFTKEKSKIKCFGAKDGMEVKL